MTEASRVAAQAFKVALRSDCMRFAAMNDRDVIARAVALVHESGLVYAPDDAVITLVRNIAAMGSIEACALLVRFGADHQTVCGALTEVARRSPDVVDGMRLLDSTKRDGE